MNQKDLYKHVFGEDYKSEAYKYKAHSFKGRVGNKPYCIHCGLVALNNDFSRWAVDKGCLNELHPSYKNQRKKTNPFRGK